MKRGIITCFFGLFAAAVIHQNSHAQTTTSMLHSNANLIAKTEVPYRLNNMKLTTGAAALPLNAVSSKAIRALERSFKDATNLVWYGMNKRRYLATFTHKDGRASMALFAKNGYMYYGISYGDEKSLRKDYRRFIKSQYVDYTFDKVFEIIFEDQKVWVINLHDDDYVVVLRLTEDGNFEEVEKYKRHAPIKKQRKNNQQNRSPE
jgi:hypothetical protein